jgi:thymidylate synthase
MNSNSTNNQWLRALKECLEHGNIVSPRGQTIKELLAYQTSMAMEYPVVTVSKRKLGYKFMAAEAAWILSGDNRVKTIEQFSKAIISFSDDGYFYHGAYGPMIRDQLHYVIDALNSDPSTRQAVLTIWRPNPRPSKDIPCTVSIQFLIRDGLLHVVDTMRSSDLWLGWPYDIFNFSMLARYVICHLKQKPSLGLLILQAGSMHLYEPHWSAAAEILQAEPKNDVKTPIIPWFQNGDDLVDWLWEQANGKGILEA